MTGTAFLKRRRLILSLAAANTIVAGSWDMARATSYSWSNTGAGGTWQNAANWTPNTGFPSSASDAGDISNSTANRTVTYVASASSAVGTLTMTQANNFLNELDVQQGGSSVLTLTAPLTLAAAGTGTSLLFLDPSAIGGTRTAGIADAAGITINSGGVLELSSYENSGGTVELSSVTANITIGNGGTLYSDEAMGTLSTDSDANTITGSLSMSTGGLLSLGAHAAPAGSNARLSGGSVPLQSDRLYVTGNLSITGGSFVGGYATDVFFLEGASNSIQLTGNVPILPVVELQCLTTGTTQTLFSDSNLTSGVLFRQTSSTASINTYDQFGTATPGGSISFARLTFQTASASGTQTVQMVSNTSTSGIPNYSGNAVSVTDIIDTNGFLFDATPANAVFALIGTTGGIDNIINSAGAASIGTVKATAFDLSKLANGENIGSYVNLLATGANTGALSTSTLSVSSAGSLAASAIIDPRSTFTFAPTATGVGTLISTRSIGNLVIQSSTLNLGSNITTGVTTSYSSAVTVAAGGTLNLNSYTLSTPSINVAGGLTGSGTFGTTSGANISGTFAPGGAGTVGLVSVAGGSVSLSGTSKFDVASSSSFDQLNLNGVNIGYGGTLALNFTYTPTTTTTYQLFSNFAAETGNFTITSNLPGTDTESFDPTSGILTVSVPEPMSIALVGLAPVLMMRRRRLTLRTV